MALALLLVVSACAGGTSTEGSRVIATTSVIADLTSSLGVEVDSLIPPGVDPHDYEITARQMRDLLEADLIVAVGLGMEEGLEAALDEARAGGVEILEIGPLVDPIPLEGGVFDPHVWTDPARMGIAVTAIGETLERLGILDVGSGAVEESNRELADLDEELRGILAGVENRKLVTDHLTLGYFADRYDFEVAGTLIPGTSSLGAPSSRDVADLVEVIRVEQLTAIFIEPGGPTDLARTVASQLDFPVSVVEIRVGSLGPEGTESASYRGMMLELARAIAGSLD